MNMKVSAFSPSPDMPKEQVWRIMELIEAALRDGASFRQFLARVKPEGFDHRLDQPGGVQ